MTLFRPLKNVPLFIRIIFGLCIFYVVSNYCFTILEKMNHDQEIHDKAVIARSQWIHPKPKKNEYYLPTIGNRAEIPIVLQELQLTTGMELGVRSGDFSKHLLDNWPNCTKFYMVDVWTKLAMYWHYSNPSEQLAMFQQAKSNTARHSHKTTMLEMSGHDATAVIADDSLDFIYIDARHDYCSVTDDLIDWWPKLRAGGVFAGHDYMSYTPSFGAGDWTKCNGDGGRYEPGTVSRAVDEFARSEELIVTITHDTPQGGTKTKTWMMRKPFKKISVND